MNRLIKFETTNKADFDYCYDMFTRLGVMVGSNSGGVHKDFIADKIKLTLVSDRNKAYHVKVLGLNTMKIRATSYDTAEDSFVFYKGTEVIASFPTKSVEYVVLADVMKF